MTEPAQAWHHSLSSISIFNTREQLQESANSSITVLISPVMEMKEFYFWEGNPSAVLIKVRSWNPAHGGGGKEEIQTHPWFSGGEACACHDGGARQH